MLGMGWVVAQTRWVGEAVARMPPAIFVGHGSPMLAVDRVRGRTLGAWGRRLARPTGIVSVTPHYRARGIEIGAVGVGHALRSYPPSFGRLVGHLRYAPPSNEALALRVTEALGARGRVGRSRRVGQDHTTWMPLLHLFPPADVPVLEVALPFAPDPEVFALGRALGALRREGVLVMASGNVTHNLAMPFGVDGPPPAWARRFDEWIARKLEASDVQALVDWRRAAPEPYLAHPDDGGHLDVLLVALGVMVESSSGTLSPRFPEEGFDASLSLRAVEMG